MRDSHEGTPQEQLALPTPEVDDQADLIESLPLPPVSTVTRFEAVPQKVRAEWPWPDFRDTMPLDEVQALAGAVEGRIEATIADQAPELLEGHLSPDLEASLRARFGDTPYAIGFNQSGTVTVEEAQAQMTQLGGIVMFQFTSLGQRFDLVDSTMSRTARPHDGIDYPRHYAINGHFGIGMGRYVIAIPQLSSDLYDRGTRGPAAEIDQYTLGSPQWYAEGRTPQDIVGLSEQGYRVINPKYCAGFLDARGNWYPNATFMQDEQDGSSVS